jgi:diketogulonate reductase-like aldo/keto reductase
VYYTSKLKNNNGYERVKRAIDKSVKDCGLGYIDLYLIHGPIGGPKARLDSWKAIVEGQKEGKLKSIGVSNFGIRHMKELVEKNTDLAVPAVNQVGTSVFNSGFNLSERRRLIFTD